MIPNHPQSSAAGVGLTTTKLLELPEPLPLEGGGHLVCPQIAYETYGALNPRRDNAILLLHALSGDAHAAGRHSLEDPRPGWWDAMVGPGRAFDTERYFVICSNVIGGCRGSTGPSSPHPEDGRPYGSRFPLLTIGDMVRAQTKLVEALGITRLHAVAGGSMGGFQALEWLTAHPERVARAIILASTARSSAQTIAWNRIGRRAIVTDPRWQGGDYYAGETPRDGLAIARMIGHITYLSEERLEARFGRERRILEQSDAPFAAEFEIEHYLEHQAASFNARFDANSYLHITRAMDRWDLPARYGSLEAALARSEAALLLIAYDSDWLYPPRESLAIAQAAQRVGLPAEYLELSSHAGHDAFLVDFAPQIAPIRAFLQR